MGTWRLTTDGVTFYPAFSIKVMKQISGLNMIQKVSSIGSGYTNDTVVRLIDPNNVEIFRGYITRVAPPEDDDDTIEDFEVQEMAKELKDTMITDGADYSVTWASSANIDLILEAMLGYSSPTWTHPDSDTTDLGTDITFESMSMLDGIYKICRQMRGHIVWFDGVNRNVRFGTSRTDRTGTPITSWIKKKTVIDTAMSNVDEVVVYGNDRSISGSYGTPSGITKAYQVLSLVNSIECTNVATQIFNQLSVPKKQIRVLIDYTNIYDEGDLVRVGVDTTDYVIHEVVLSETETWIGLNSATESIFDAQPMVGVNEGGGDTTAQAFIDNGGAENKFTDETSFWDWIFGTNGIARGTDPSGLSHSNLEDLLAHYAGGEYHIAVNERANKYGAVAPTSVNSQWDSQIYIDDVLSKIYINKSTAASPLWAQIYSSNIVIRTINPTIDDDETLFHSIDDLWVNKTLNTYWTCTDATDGAAVWVNITSTGSGTGDVVGPASATDSNFVSFDSTTGKVIKDSGYSFGTFAPVAKGVTNGDSHDHVGGDGGDLTTGTTSIIDSIVDAASEVFSSLYGFSGSFDALQGLGTDEIQWYINYGQAPGSPNGFNLDLIFDRGSLGDAILRWNEDNDEFEFLDAGGASKTNIFCSSVKTTSGIVLDADETTPKTKIFDEGSAGAKDIVVQVKTGRSVIFRTVI